MTDTAIAPVSEAQRMLERAGTPLEVNAVRLIAKGWQQAFKERGDHLRLQNEAAKVKIRAERKLSGMLERLPREGGGRPRKNSSTPLTSLQDALEELGVSRELQSRWAKENSLNDEALEGWFAAKEEREDEITSSGLIQFIRGDRMGVHFTSDSPEWYTPQEITDRVVALFGQIDLDPCSNSETAPAIPATHHFTREDDGLVQHWFGRVYMNSPYGDEIGDWTRKARAEYLGGDVEQLVALVPARTDTGWWQDLADFPVCFVRGRLKFSDSQNSAPFPSAVVYMGPHLAAFADAFCEMGPVYARVREWVEGNDGS